MSTNGPLLCTYCALREVDAGTEGVDSDPASVGNARIGTYTEQMDGAEP